MAMTIEAIFDGLVLRPEEPLDLEEGTRVRIAVETVPPAGDKPRSFLQTALVSANRARFCKPRSFLQTARSLQLEGPPDWSANIDQYLYGQEASQEHDRITSVNPKRPATT